jgi:UDP-glucose:(heptosyl)LPS alpha-1,3-glucosyltransferase
VLADPRVRLFVAISRSMARQLEGCGVAPRRIRIVPNAVVAPSIDREQRAALRAARRRELDLDAAAPVFLFPALDARRKGLAPLLRTFALVRARLPASVLLLAGPFPGRYRRLAARLGVAGAVRHVGRVDDLTPTLCAADVMVMPTFYDPASKVVMEALCAGTPAITTSYDGSAECIEACGDPAAGAVVGDPRDEAALAAAMVSLAGSAWGGPTPQLRRRLGMDQHVTALEAILDEVRGAASGAAVVAVSA